MPQVKSKYKNPDKYIERLKDDIKYAGGSSRYHQNEADRLRGTSWFSYSDGISTSVVLGEEGLMGARLNQPVVLLGRIIGYKKKGRDTHTVEISLKNVALKEG